MRFGIGESLAFGAMLMMIAGSTAGAGDLEVGDPAPGFTLQASDGKEYSLEQFEGDQTVVLAWFPKAFTGG